MNKCSTISNNIKEREQLLLLKNIKIFITVKSLLELFGNVKVELTLKQQENREIFPLTGKSTLSLRKLIIFYPNKQI